MSDQSIKNGDEVRVIKTGRTGIVSGINPNPNREEDDEYWAELESDDWFDTIDRPEDVVLLRRAEDIPVKRLPTPRELVDAFSSSLHSGFGDEVSINETDTGGEPDGQFLAYGTSSTGQRFGCRVTISEIERTDY